MHRRPIHDSKVTLFVPGAEAVAANGGGKSNMTFETPPETSPPPFREYDDRAGNGRTNAGFEASDFHRNFQTPSTSSTRPGLIHAYEPPHTAAPVNGDRTRRPSSLAVAMALNDDPSSFPGIPPDDPYNPPKDNRGCCDKFQDSKDEFIEKMKHDCSRKLLFKRMPILKWLPKYNTSLAISDLVAGVTVGLTILPQSIAFAGVAGVPPQNGLYSAFFGCFLYIIFGSTTTAAVGPTALQAILTSQYSLTPAFATLLCFFSGLLQILMGILQLGFIIDFISGPVSTGFTSAAALVIITTQIKDLLGIKVLPGQFVYLWTQIAAQIHNTRLWDAVLGFSCIIFLFGLKSLTLITIGPKDMREKNVCQKIITHTLWLICMARNIVIVVLCAVMAYLFEVNGMMPFKLTGNVAPGLPEFKPPPFTTVYNNHTYDFMEMASTLSAGTFVVGIIAVVENIATAKVFANGVPIDATQEMLTIGASCVLTSFVGGMPITGSLSRGAVNAASGVKTQFGNIYTGVIVLLALAFLTPYFYYIPKTSLAAVIVMAVVSMVEYEIVKPIWKTKKVDLIPAFGTFLGCLFYSLEIGIIIGVGLNIIIVLYRTARPKLTVEHEKSITGIDYLLATPDRSLNYPSVEYVKAMISKAGIKQGMSSIPVVVDSTHISTIDYTAAKGVKILMADYMKRNQLIIFFNLKPSIVKSLNAVKPKDFHYCSTLQELDAMLRSHTEKNRPLALGYIISKPEK